MSKPLTLREQLIEAIVSADSGTKFEYEKICEFEAVMQKYGKLADAVLVVLSKHNKNIKGCALRDFVRRKTRTYKR